MTPQIDLSADGFSAGTSPGVSLGEQLRRIRKAHGATQVALGLGVGVSTATISMWENGRRHPTGKHMAAVREFFGVLANISPIGAGSLGYDEFMIESRESIAKFVGTSADKIRIMIEI
ncbi:helix-turn-helix transcriptional regulator [Sphingopyxis sp.]|uniref:helix-turn-helix transcriptional regulator n=1 Tax=Sphingopyxis sp. TaxID=1908224 RepID=UPI003D0ECCB4